MSTTDFRFFDRTAETLSRTELTALQDRLLKSVVRRTALSNSCNYAFAQIAVTVGQDNMKKYVNEYGFTERHELNGITMPAHASSGSPMYGPA